jgi:hypothetical protein
LHLCGLGGLWLGGGSAGHGLVGGAGFALVAFELLPSLAFLGHPVEAQLGDLFLGFLSDAGEFGAGADDVGLFVVKTFAGA